MEHDKLEDDRKARDAISAIYEVMHKRVVHADNSMLMKCINDIVSDSIEVRVDDQDKEKKFDISKIDFDRLRAEFMKRKHQNLLLQDLQQLVEERLAEMLGRNPSRIDYYERYQAIIQNYNAEQDRAAIEKVFSDLLDLANDLDSETERYICEGFENEEQLLVAFENGMQHYLISIPYEELIGGDTPCSIIIGREGYASANFANCSV